MGYTETGLLLFHTEAFCAAILVAKLKLDLAYLRTCILATPQQQRVVYG